MISFVSKGFAYKDQIEELFIVIVYGMYSQHVTLSNFLINFTFVTATYLSKARYSLFVLKVPLSPINKSICVKVAMLLVILH